MQLEDTTMTLNMVKLWLQMNLLLEHKIEHIYILKIFQVLRTMM